MALKQANQLCPWHEWELKVARREPEALAQCDAGQRAEATIRARPRPTQPIFFHNCRRLSFEGILIRNAPCWTISPPRWPYASREKGLNSFAPPSRMYHHSFAVTPAASARNSTWYGLAFRLASPPVKSAAPQPMAESSP